MIEQLSADAGALGVLAGVLAWALYELRAYRKEEHPRKCEALERIADALEDDTEDNDAHP